MKISQKILSVVVVCILLFSLIFSGSVSNTMVYADEVNEIQQQMENLLSEKENIASQKAQCEAELLELKDLKSSSQENLNWLSERSEEQQVAYSELKVKQDTILAIQASYLENLDTAKQNFNAKVEQYGDRVETMFSMQNKSILELFLESDSLECFFTSTKFMRIITDDDEDALEELEQEQADLLSLTAETKEKIEINNEELVQINSVLEEIETDINYQVDEIYVLDLSINTVADQIDTFEASEGEIQAALAQAEANLAAIEAARAAEEERLRIEAEEAAAAAAAQAEADRLAAQAAEQANENQGGSNDQGIGESTPTPTAPPVTTPPSTTAPPAPTVPEYTGGGLAWPVPSSYRITSHYGYRSFGGYSDFHTGTDVGAPTGTPVVAPAAGTVTYVGWMNVGGNTVIINHGNGMSTMYCHLSGYAVSVGQQVSTGQTICYIGSTGFSTGPHLHYEIRINGSSVNPMTYY